MSSVEQYAKEAAAAKEVLAEYTPEELAEVRAWPTTKKQELCAALLMRGLNKTGIAEVLGMRPQSVVNWFQREPDQMREFIKAAQTREALFAVPENFKLLMELRNSKNAETRRKAALDLYRMAGIPIDALNAAIVNNTMNVRGGDVNLHGFTYRELNAAIAKLAGELGPEAVALAKKQIGPTYDRLIDAPPGSVVVKPADPGREAGAVPAAAAGASPA